MDFGIRVLPFVIGAVVNMVLGALWYSPVLFAKPWMKEAGITEEYVKVSQGKMGKVYMFTTLFSFITSYVIGFLIINTGVAGVIGGLVVAMLVWLGTNAPFIVKNWGFEDSRSRGWLLQCGQWNIVSGAAAAQSPPIVFLLFSMLTFVAGVINGVDFPLTAACYMALSKRAEKSAGTVYSVELFGACVGAALASAVVAPMLGIIACCLFAGIANGTAYQEYNKSCAIGNAC